jgi:DNA invertase Pin-like site-specific DNA recombinase
MKKNVAQYKRVSSEEQNTARQETIIFGAKVYSDKCSGSIAFNKRTFGNELLSDIDSGLISEVHVHSIDRLGRNTLDIMQTIQYMTSKGICVISAKEGLRTLNEDGSENMVAKMMVGILGTLAEFELNRMKERQKEGIVKAKERGAYNANGRPTGTLESVNEFMNKKLSKKIQRELSKGRSLRETSKICECSLTTVQKVVKYMKETEMLQEHGIVSKVVSGYEHLE